MKRSKNHYDRVVSPERGPRVVSPERGPIQHENNLSQNSAYLAINKIVLIFKS